jgi:Arc/MetJ family transcription regulator
MAAFIEIEACRITLAVVQAEGVEAVQGRKPWAGRSATLRRPSAAGLRPAATDSAQASGMTALPALSWATCDVYTLYQLYTRWIFLTRSNLDMRTNIEIDDKLMRDALKATGLKTKKDAVELGLKTLIRLKKQENIRSLRGKLKWSGDLDDMRTAS